MRKNERFALLSREGDFWYIARNRRGEEGYIPSVYITVDGTRPAEILYKAWREGCDRLMAAGAITLDDWAALHVPKQAIRCEELGCRAWKGAGDGKAGRSSSANVCVHDLTSFFESEVSYGIEWLKTERLRWHPDRFAARCKPEAREELSRRASHMFKTMSKLYDKEVARVAMRPAEARPTNAGRPSTTHHDVSKGPDASLNAGSTTPFAPPPCPSTTVLAKSSMGRSGDVNVSIPSVTLAPNFADSALEGPTSTTSKISGRLAHEVHAHNHSSSVMTGESPDQPNTWKSEMPTRSHQHASPTSSSHKFNPSAQDFKPRSSSDWHSISFEEDIILEASTWPRKISHHSVQDSLYTLNQLQSIEECGVTDVPSRLDMTSSSCHIAVPDASSPSASSHDDSNDEREQQLLVQARNEKFRATMLDLSGPKSIAPTGSGMRSPADHRPSVRKTKVRETTRERWCRPPRLEERVALQARRHENLESLKAKVASRRAARAEQQSSMIFEWRQSVTESDTSHDTPGVKSESEGHGVQHLHTETTEGQHLQRTRADATHREAEDLNSAGSLSVGGPSSRCSSMG